ncbi:HAD-IIA family hydrolase [Propionibacteriaceae bacterium Y2011]
MSDRPLIAGHDAALFDLDGVVYLGPQPVPAAAPTIAELKQQGVHCAYVTNNASRTPEQVAEHLVELQIPTAATDVITSSQAVARVLVERFPAGSPVFVLGAPALVDEVARAGMRPVFSVADQPAAVVQGLSAAMTWHDLCEATVAIHRGATWIAANTDSTRPTERGQLPGCGAAVAAVATAVDVDPVVVGKPHAPLMVETLERLGAESPIFVGDRLDTDIAGAVTVGIDSLLVLSGAHSVADLLAAGPDRRPTHLGADVSALLKPAREVEITDAGVRCGGQTVQARGNSYEWQGRITSGEDWLDAAWALANLHWRAASAGTDPYVIMEQLGPRPEEDR